MKASQFLVTTQKDAPADAEVASQRLMLRAGFIKRAAAGIYSYMPMGLRVLRKVEAIVREEMDRAGAIELLMPIVQPAELWAESGRIDKYGPELLRVKDRHDRDFVIQPTSEEVVTDIARQELRSYRQLPKNFYHIQTKFRDERRPRFGVMRGREFTMKDAYSFDRDATAAGRSYDAMSAAYRRIFDRFGLDYRAVAADSGAIGGDRSQEFQVIAATGEDAIVYCPTSDYAANIELAECVPLLAERAEPTQACALTPTPGAATCADVAALLGLPIERTVKSLVLATDRLDAQGAIVDSRIWLLLVRGDHALNEVKTGKLPGFAGGFRFATVAEIETHFAARPGFLGPLFPLGAEGGSTVSVIAERTVALMSDFVCGANLADHHYTGVNWGRDLPEPTLVADIRDAVAGDPSPDGLGVLAIERGIEVGHVFYLGTQYSRPMQATFLDETGKPQFLEMGCYGIGVSRILGAAIEQKHDERGMVWPVSIAPFQVVVCPIGADRSETVAAASAALHDALLAAGIDAILDDRGQRPGAMFADWELIGIPWRVVLSDRGLKDGLCEVQARQAAEPEHLAVDAVVAHLQARLDDGRAASRA